MFFRIFKYLAITLAGLGVLMTGGIWYAQSHVSGWAKSYAQEFGQSIGYLIDFNELNVSIHGPKVSLSELKVVELANQHHLLDIKNLQVKAAWLPLLQKKIEISDIQIDQAHLVLEKSTDDWNWLKFIEAIQKKFPAKEQDKPSKPMAFLIKELRFKDGSLKVNDSKMKIDIVPLNFELKNASNIDKTGKLGGLETQYDVDLGQVTLPIPKSEQPLKLGRVLLGGDFDLDANKDMIIAMKAKIDEGIIDTKTHIYKTQNKIESDIHLEQLDLVPFMDFATPKVSRADKSGKAFGDFKFIRQDKNMTIDGDLNIENVSLAPLISLAPTINTIYAKSGGASGKLKIHYDPQNTNVEGDIKLQELAIFEPDKTSELLGWKSANIQKFYFEENPRARKLRVEDVKVDGLKGRFVIYGDKSSNFRRMFKPSSAEIKRIDTEKIKKITEPTESKQSRITLPESMSQIQSSFILPVVSNPKTSSSKSNSATTTTTTPDDEDLQESKAGATKKPFNFNMKSIEIIRGLIEFSDFSIKPNFKVDIENFHGTLIGISTYPKRYATGAFEGLIAPSGDMKLNAKIAFEDSRRNNELQLSFRRIPLASINPYYTTFAGYEVKSGTLSYDSSYLTKDGNLKGDNRFIINQMQLGNKVPDYKGKNIPMELIIALLEDENGVIDLNLKVEGNVDKPDFKIGDLIWDAVWTIVGNVVSAPFKMIGRLIGIEGYTGVYFEPGKSTLRPSESLKLENIVAGMQKRPKTQLKINGVYDPQEDKINLNTEKVDREIFKNGGFQLSNGEPLPQLPLEDERVQRAIRRIYATMVGPIPSELKLKPGPEGLADWKLLHDQMVAKEQVTEEELEKLANTRALTIKNELIRINKDIDSRIKVTELKKETAEKDGVPVGIEIVSN